MNEKSVIFGGIQQTVLGKQLKQEIYKIESRCEVRINSADEKFLKNLLRLPIILFLFFLLFGCSSTRLYYNYLDWIISWRLDDYINFNNEQTDWFEQQLDGLLIWHRQDQLPRYIQFVEQFQRDVTRPITVELLKQRSQTIQDFWRDIMAQAEPDIYHLMLWLSQEQRQLLFENISKKQEELAEKYLKLTSDKRQQRRIKQTEKVFKRFIGKLTSEQKTALESWAKKLSPSQRLWMENRRTWLTRLQEVLNANESESYKREQLHRLFVEPESFWSKEYRIAVDQNQLITYSLLVTIHEQLTEKQKKHLGKVLGNLKKDFVYLSNN
jgi:hypothetical protein